MHETLEDSEEENNTTNTDLTAQLTPEEKSIRILMDFQVNAQKLQDQFENSLNYNITDIITSEISRTISSGNINIIVERIEEYKRGYLDSLKNIYPQNIDELLPQYKDKIDQTTKKLIQQFNNKILQSLNGYKESVIQESNKMNSINKIIASDKVNVLNKIIEKLNFIPRQKSSAEYQKQLEEM